MTLEESMVAYFDRKGFIEYVGKDPCRKMFPDQPEPTESADEFLEADMLDAIPAVLDSVEDLPEPSLRDILEAVVTVTGVSSLCIKSPRRYVRIVRARMILIYLARSMTSKSFPQIGKFLNRDHTTALHGFKKVDESRDRYEPELSRVISHLRSLNTRPSVR